VRKPGPNVAVSCLIPGVETVPIQRGPRPFLHKSLHAAPIAVLYYI